jgi:hypothetical protein
MLLFPVPDVSLSLFAFRKRFTFIYFQETDVETLVSDSPSSTIPLRTNSLRFLMISIFGKLLISFIFEGSVSCVFNPKNGFSNVDHEHEDPNVTAHS